MKRKRNVDNESICEMERQDKTMKKWTRILGVTIFLLAMVGCGTNQKTTEEVTETRVTNQQETVEQNSEVKAEQVVRVIALKGPTAMGLVSFMNDVDTGIEKNYEFQMVGSVDEVAPKLLKGEVDFAAVPANLASVLFEKSKGQIQVIGINTLGVLHIVENGNEIQSVNDLKGKTIIASGKGATPEYALQYILEKNGLDINQDVTVEWKSEHTECLSALAGAKNTVAMIPQPFVTVAQTKMPKLRVAIDMTKEWERLQEKEKVKSSLITGVVVGRTSFLEEQKELVDDFMNRYKVSVEDVNKNIEKSAKLIGNYDIVPEEVAKKAIPNCNITWIEGQEMKEQLSGYLTVLYNQNKKAVGGKIPNDEFYYTR